MAIKIFATGTNWNKIQENDNINNGDAIDEINNLTYQDFFLNSINKTWDFIIYMKISDITVALNVEKLWLYL